LGNFNSFQIAIESCLDWLSGSRRSAITHLLTHRSRRPPPIRSNENVSLPTAFGIAQFRLFYTS